MTTHGATRGRRRTAEHMAWAGMIQRCTNSKLPGYKDYGGRGIKVCRRWAKFENFLADMGPRPTARHELDRCNNSRGYTKRNCHWATRWEQAANKRNNHRIAFQGRRLHVAEWAREKNLHVQTILWRLRQGWTVARALITPTFRGARVMRPRGEASYVRRVSYRGGPFRCQTKGKAFEHGPRAYCPICAKRKAES